MSDQENFEAFLLKQKDTIFKKFYDAHKDSLFEQFKAQIDSELPTPKPGVEVTVEFDDEYVDFMLVQDDSYYFWLNQFEGQRTTPRFLNIESAYQRIRTHFGDKCLGITCATNNDEEEE